MKFILKAVLLLVFPCCYSHCTSSQPKYHIATYTSNWFEAAEYCHRMNKQLAILDSEEKQNAAVEAAQAEELHLSGFFGVWLGATDLARTGNFVWHNTGARMRFSRWKPGEPSGRGEHCVVLYYWPKQGFNWTWNDAPCSTELYAICESAGQSTCIQEF
nr:perlucin-like protein [Aedes albopictus]